MDDVSIAVTEAFNRVWPRLQANPDELAQRLARRRTRLMRAPPRSWCVAVRASDARIHPASAIIVPEDAAYPRRPELYAEHEVTLDTRLLRRLHHPVAIDGYGLTRQQAAKELGISTRGVDSLIRRGVIRAETMPYGIRGQPIKILRSERSFDPSSSSSKGRPDPVWGANWGHLAEMVPDDFAQDVTRIPHRDAKTRRFRGWRWICPGCRRVVCTLFYPVQPIDLPTFLGLDPATHEADQIQPPPPTFGCVLCHRVQYWTRVGTRGWNQMIAYISGGLLYGAEVQRPKWLTQDRKRAFARRPNRQVTARHGEVQDRLIAGMTYNQIAKDLGIALPTVCFHAKRIYKRHGVHSRAALIATASGNCSTRSSGA